MHRISNALTPAIRAPRPFAAPSLSRPSNNIVRKTIIYLKMDAATLPPIPPPPPPIASTCTSYSLMQGPLPSQVGGREGAPRNERRKTCDPFWRCGRACRGEACLRSQLVGKTLPKTFLHSLSLHSRRKVLLGRLSTSTLSRWALKVFLTPPRECTVDFFAAQ